MATNTEKIVVQVIVKGDKQLDRLTQKTKKAAKSAGGVTKGFAKMVAGMTAAAVVFRQINQLVSSTIKTFTKFEFQMAKVKATTGASNKEFKKLTATAQQLGRTTFFTASQVGALQMNFAKLGFSTSEILDAQEATLRLATAAGAAVRGFGLDASETERVVDVMAVAFTSSALDIEKWQTSMTKVAPIAAGANVSIEMTAAIMGKLTDAGIEASIAGTSMRNIFLKMQDSASDLSKHLGFTVKSSADMEKALKQLSAEGLSNEEIMGLVDLRQVAAFKTMVDGTFSILDMVDALEDANGAAQRMADIMADTLEGDLITAKSAWEGFQLSIMTGSNNISKWLREAVQTWTFILNRWSDSFKTTEDVATDIFTNITKTAKEETKKFNKDFGEGATTFSRQLYEEVNTLKNSLGRLERLAATSKLKIEKLVGDGSGARMWVNAEAIDKEKKVHTERVQRLEATKLAIIDLTEEIEVQKKKEVAAEETANLKKWQSDQQAIRDKEKGLKKTEREINTAYKKEVDATQEKFEILKNKEKQKLIDGLHTQETYNAEIEKKTIEHYNKLIKINEDYGKGVAQLQGKIKDIQIKGIEEVADALDDSFVSDVSDEYWNSLLDNVINGTATIKEAEQDLRDFQIDLIDNLLLDENLSVEARAELDNQLTQLKLDNANAVADNDKEKLEATKEMSRQKLEVMKAASDAIFTIMADNLSSQTDRETKKLEERKDAGLITEEQYEEGVEAIQRKAFEKKKRLDIAQAIINGALAMTTVMGQTGVLSFAFSPFIAAMTAAQIAVIASQKFALGGMVEEFAKGGMVNGKSHAQGGEKFAVGGRVVELEGGEAVINKRSTAMFRPQLSAMNSAGGGVRFADGGLLNQPSFNQQQFNALGQNQMMGAMGGSRKVVVVEADITDSQDSVSVIQAQATI